MDYRQKRILKFQKLDKAIELIQDEKMHKILDPSHELVIKAQQFKSGTASDLVSTLNKIIKDNQQLFVVPNRPKNHKRLFFIKTQHVSDILNKNQSDQITNQDVNKLFKFGFKKFVPQKVEEIFEIKNEELKRTAKFFNDNDDHTVFVNNQDTSNLIEEKIILQKCRSNSPSKVLFGRKLQSFKPRKTSLFKKKN